MIGDMLALRAPKEGFVEFVAQQAEGNPFFVAEYLRTAVTERVLYRDENHAWQLGGEGRAGATEEYRSLPLPGSLRELIEQRLRRLSPAALRAGLAAAVLGREADFELVRRMAALSEDEAFGAADELVRRQVIEQADQGRVRFAHDKLREVAYARAPAEQVVGLHARAAAALEERWKDRRDASAQWATLGHHFAAAKMAEPAAKYFALAGDHARAIYANGEAIRLYRESIKHVNQVVLSFSGDTTEWSTQLPKLHESLADLLALGAKRADARESYAKAMSHCPEHDRLPRARLNRKIGKTWETEHQPGEAVACYDWALDALSSDVESAADWHEWIQIHIDKLWVHYYQNRIREIEDTISKLEPIIDARALPEQRARFFQSRMLLDFRRGRYVVGERTVGFARAAVAACKEVGGQPELPAAQFVYGFSLLLRNSREDAKTELQTALALAKRAGDAPLQSRCLTYLTLVARMRGSMDDVRIYTEQSTAIGSAAGAQEYLAAAYGNRAWLSLRANDLESAETHAKEALDLWKRVSALFPFHWLALVPLMDSLLRREQLDGAIDCAKSLFAPGQQYLPGAAADAIGDAIVAFESSDRSKAASCLALALRRLEDAGYR
jgi:tetratricopeptide (TPR) repeat protein